MIRSACVIATATIAIVVAAGIEHVPTRAQAAPASGGPIDPALLQDLVAANRILADEGVLDAYGHVSIRHPGNPNRYLMSRSLAPILVNAADIMEYDLDSNPVDPKGRTSVLERFIHGEIYKARPVVKAVIHSHSPAVIPFGITQVPMRPVYHLASFLWVGVPVYEIRDAGGPATSMLVRNGSSQKPLPRTLGDKPVGADARTRQLRGWPRRQDGGSTCDLHRGERAPADNRVRHRWADQLHLCRRGRRQRYVGR